MDEYLVYQLDTGTSWIFRPEFKAPTGPLPKLVDQMGQEKSA